ncbi:zinc finger BED domain-containing protein RICESLEEPER 2-like [Apium graveolens]|uniref:zinc finger BED domain-containing protein RICESLEEPER 2-like n=1 Tax=Apium graveolens TaxID=4045 RepID=UPI003D7A8ADC
MKKSDTGSTSSSKEKESEVTNEQWDKQTEEVPKPYTIRPRKKTPAAWKFLEEFEQDGEKWARCKLCHQELKRGPTSSTSSLNRHVDKCKIIHGLGLQKRAQLQFQPGDSSSEVTIANFKYDYADMRKNVSHYIMVNELPFIHVESFMFNELMRKATPFWQKISRATVKSDCMSTYEIEKKKLKDIFNSVKRINVTTDMLTSSSQKIEYMVITAHWIDCSWKLNMIVISFCNVPPPHSGFVVAEAISKCLTNWEIVDKIGTVSVDNAKANDVVLRTLKNMYDIRKTSLLIEGKLFQVRCCAHILNLCVKDGLEPIDEIIEKIRDGVKYVAALEGCRIKYAEIAKHLYLKTKKLILDVPTRWKSTFKMLICAIEFKQVFQRYPSFDKGFLEYVPNAVDWEKVEGICSILEAFNPATNIVSGTHYPTSNLFLEEIKKVKQILDQKSFD